MENKTYIIENRNLKHFDKLKWVIKAKSSDEKRQNLTYVYVKDEIYYATDGHRLHVYSPDYNELPNDYLIPDGCYEVLTNNKKQIIFRGADAQAPDFDRLLNYRPYNGVSDFVYDCSKKYGDNFDLLLYHIFTNTEQCFNHHYIDDAIYPGLLKFERTSPQKGGLHPLVFGCPEQFAMVMPLRKVE